MTNPDPNAPLPDYIQQPGPNGAAYSMAQTRTVGMDFMVPADVPLAESLALEIKNQGLTGAYFRIRNAKMSKLHYVIPGLSKDDDHVAWYSDTYIAEMPGKILDAGITCGDYGAGPFYHCHGHIKDVNDIEAVGHLLPETCTPSRPTRITGHGFRDARFNRVFDAQTGFELFVTEPVTPAPPDIDGILLRITPNIEITAPLIECVRNAGWDRATVHGVGSIIGAHFADGRTLDSFATELLITDGVVDLTNADPKCSLNIILVGLDGKFKTGLLQRNSNPVLITAEILLKR